MKNIKSALQASKATPPQAEEKQGGPNSKYRESITFSGVLKMLAFLSVYFLIVVIFWLTLDSFFTGSRFEFNLPGLAAFLAGLLVFLAIALFCISLGVATGEYKVKSIFVKKISIGYCIFCVFSFIVLRFMV